MNTNCACRFYIFLYTVSECGQNYSHLQGVYAKLKFKSISLPMMLSCYVMYLPITLQFYLLCPVNLKFKFILSILI